MVGALSPRKGYREALEAFEILWASGYDFNLVIVGKSGWKANDIAADIKSHRELGRRLFWFEGASDEVLAVLYKNASALIAASHAEGFGLPLIEAARMGLPLIARDIAVFREVAGEGAFYFPDGGAAALASAILRWHALALEGREPKPSDVKSLSWAESAENLKGIIIDGNWYAEFGGRGDG